MTEEAQITITRGEGESAAAYRSRVDAARRAAAPPIKWRHLGVRVTLAEHDQITATAKARGLTVSDYVRSLVAGG